MPYLLVGGRDKLASTTYVVVIALLRPRGVTLETDIHKSTSGAIDAPPSPLPLLPLPPPHPTLARDTHSPRMTCAHFLTPSTCSPTAHTYKTPGGTHAHTPCNYSTLVNPKSINGHTYKHDFSCANMRDSLGQIRTCSPAAYKSRARRCRHGELESARLPVMPSRFTARNCSR